MRPIVAPATAPAPPFGQERSRRPRQRYLPRSVAFRRVRLAAPQPQQNAKLDARYSHSPRPHLGQALHGVGDETGASESSAKPVRRCRVIPGYRAKSRPQPLLKPPQSPGNRLHRVGPRGALGGLSTYSTVTTMVFGSLSSMSCCDSSGSSQSHPSYRTTSRGGLGGALRVSSFLRHR